MLYRRASENLQLVTVSIKPNGIHSYIKTTEKGSACSYTQEEHDLPCFSPFLFDSSLGQLLSLDPSKNSLGVYKTNFAEEYYESTKF